MKKKYVAGRPAEQFLKSLGTVAEKVEAEVGRGRRSLADGLGRGVQLVRDTAQRGNTVLFVGNGGSAAIASHMALDFWNAGKIPALAFNDPAQLTCMANDNGYENVFAEPIRRMAKSNDLLVAISSSGRSPSILNAVTAASAAGCAILTLSGFDRDNPLRATGDLNFYVPSPSYGVVEAIHLSLLVSILEESNSLRRSLRPHRRVLSASAVRPINRSRPAVPRVF